jgi:hypothetical protein
MWRTAWVALSLLAPASAQAVGDLPDQNQHYFPICVFAAGKSGYGGLSARWYAEEPRGLKEPNLSGSAAVSETVYRFTWLRSFHHPIAVRMATHSPKAMDFRRMPSEQPFDGVGINGAQWILEGFEPDQYHVIDRWSNQVERAPFRELALHLANTLGKLRVPRKEVY